jgi:hypothetical protein
MNRKLIGKILSGISVLFLILDSGMKISFAKPSVDATLALGFPESSVITIGLILMVFICLHVVPKISVMGAILITGFLGGAVAAQFRLGNPLFSHILFPIYVASFMWGGLLLRYPVLNFLILTENKK